MQAEGVRGYLQGGKRHMDEEAFSIYFGLEQGSRIDIDVLAACLIDVSKAVTEISYFLDPGLSLRVEVVRGADGSLKLDLVLKILKAVAPSRKTLQTTLFAFVRMLIGDTRQYTVDKIFDWLMEQYHHKTELTDASELKPENKGEVTTKVKELEQNDIGGVHIRNFYGNMYVDPHITGVGVSPSHDSKEPEIVVHRHEFPEKAHLPNTRKVSEVRVLREEMRVTLVSPVLIAGQRKWRFRGQFGEFSAPINDNNFKRKFLAGQTDVKLQTGIDMDVFVSTLENKINGVWQVSSREIVEVKGFRPSQHQGSFDFGR